MSIIKDARVDTLSVNRTVILPIVDTVDNTPLKAKIIYNATDNLLSYANGTEWQDVASGGDIADIEAEIVIINNNIVTLQTDVNNIEAAPVILTSGNASFPSGSVLTEGTGIAFTPGIGTLTIEASSTLVFISLHASPSFTLPSPYTIPVEAVNPTLYITGGGGGGGGANTVANGTGGGGGGAGAGMIYNPAPGETIAYVLGTPGAGGVSGANGSPGGNTTVTINAQLGPSFVGGDGGLGGGIGTRGAGGVATLTADKAYPTGYFNGSNGGDGGLLAAAGTAGLGMGFKYAGGAGGADGADGGGGGGGAGSLFGAGGAGGASGAAGTSVAGSAFGAGGGGASGVGPSAATGGDGGAGEVVLTYWIPIANT